MTKLAAASQSVSLDEGDVRPSLRLLMASPRGFCAGVRRAIAAVEDALALHGAPVYVRRPIVHNLAVVHMLEAEGAIFVQELDEVPRASVVILSAHGVAPAVREECRARGLRIYDAVCPLVAKVHRQVERYERDQRQIILIGHREHPEIEGTLGHLRSGKAEVVNSVTEALALRFDETTPTAIAVQTTFSVGEAEAIVATIKSRFDDLEQPSTSDICYATTNRQLAVRQIADRSEAVIVVGESFSSNARRLAEVASLSCGSVQLIAEASELDWTRLPPSGVAGLTSAASTPEISVQGVIAALQSRYRLEVEEVASVDEGTTFKRVPVG